MPKATAGRIREISNAELTLADIPSPKARWSTLNLFALSLNGYKALGDQACARIANEGSAKSLTELRAALFYEQRRWRFTTLGDETPSGPWLVDIRSLVERIRAKVVERDRRRRQ